MKTVHIDLGNAVKVFEFEGVYYWESQKASRIYGPFTTIYGAMENYRDYLGKTPIESTPSKVIKFDVFETNVRYVDFKNKKWSKREF